MTFAQRLLLAVQASLLLSGTLGAPGAVQAGRLLLAAAATPPSSIINTILAAGKGSTPLVKRPLRPRRRQPVPSLCRPQPRLCHQALAMRTCSLPVAPWECRFTLVNSA